MNFEILGGLPGTGPLPVQFPPHGNSRGSEGFVVRFKVDGRQWVGNFRPGSTNVTGVYQHPNRKHVVVLASGNAYVIDPNTANQEHSFGGIDDLVEIAEPPALIFSDGIRLEMLTANGVDWSTERISWDGIRKLRRCQDRVFGEACNAGEDQWEAFSVEIATGRVHGGTYTTNLVPR